MSESYWIKILSDGSEEKATLEDVDRGLGSWTKGRQDIKSVILSHGGTTVSLSGNVKEFFQFDNYQTTLSDGSSTGLLVSREIGCVLGEVKTIMAFPVNKNRKLNVSVGDIHKKATPLPDEATAISIELAFDGALRIKYL